MTPPSLTKLLKSQLILRHNVDHESPLPVSLVIDCDQEFDKQAELATKAEALAASSAANRDPGSLGGLKLDINQAAIQLAREVRP